MCGIIGYIGRQQALPIILDGLKNMEYRGYDSAGTIVATQTGIFAEKAVGKIAALGAKVGDPSKIIGSLAIGHTRWATHGGVTEQNAHPHADCGENLWLVHNGIVENHKELKKELIEVGHVFKSETDTEVLVHLIEEARKKHRELELEDVLRISLQKVRGTYGIAVMDRREPQKLIAARNFSPLLLGIGENEYFVASDVSAVIKYTRSIAYLNDGEIAVLTPEGFSVYDFDRNLQTKKLHEIEWSAEEAEKGGYSHFMLKEIFEEPEAIENSMRGRLFPETGEVRLAGLEKFRGILKNTRRILISACGTAYLAGVAGKYMLEEQVGIPAEADVASEFRYRKPVFCEGDLFLALSQSGETADTLAALREAVDKKIPALGIVNVVGSTLARETDAGMYQHIGPEIGVASTKAFTSQIALLTLLTLFLRQDRGMDAVESKRIADALAKIPDLMRRILEKSEYIKEIAKKYCKYENFLYLGRKYNMPVALEGALKLKEISYVHAEGYGAGEMKHGPIAMIDGNFPSVFIAPQDSVYEKMLSNIEEVRARKGPIIAVATEGDMRIRELADDVLYIPKTLELLTPLLTVVPLQLFAYYIGVLRGLDVDKPRNLAKSVTVE
ncbi:MAG: glutamine--fructose-6-phosphate transaminase (isomerizing) [Candidatus Sungbacteria bacterium]|nr:glutamine--fructose-6-phosphate transaminase (isomerizing) [Candidatus Sungbacteria bacterium]